MNIASSSANIGIQQNLANFSKLADKISDPDSLADASDIVAFKDAATKAEIGVAVLKKVTETQRLVDIIA